MKNYAVFYYQKLEVDMVASTDIKYYVHTNPNAPQLNNVQGSMIAVLDACLVNGITLGTVNSMTATGTTVTVSFGSVHDLLRYQVVKITGAAQTEYNGEHRILSVPTASSITFEVSAPPSTSLATGTIVASLPPLGWSLPFTSTGKRAYKNSDLEGPYLRVVDEVDASWNQLYYKYAKVGMVEQMTDIDTISGQQVPFDAALPNKNWVGTGSGNTAINGWAKWYYAGANLENIQTPKSVTPPNGPRHWVIVGDGSVFYIFNRLTVSVNNLFIINGFGKGLSLSKINSSPYFLAANYDYTAGNYNSYMSYSALTTTSTAASNLYFFRNYKNEANLSLGVSRVFGGATNEYCGFTATFEAPNSYVGSLISNYVLAETMLNNSLVSRVRVPILTWVHQRTPYTPSMTLSEEGRAFYVQPCISYTYEGQILFDLGEL